MSALPHYFVDATLLVNDTFTYHTSTVRSEVNNAKWGDWVYCGKKYDDNTFEIDADNIITKINSLREHATTLHKTVEDIRTANSRNWCTGSFFSTVNITRDTIETFITSNAQERETYTQFARWVYDWTLEEWMAKVLEAGRADDMVIQAAADNLKQNIYVHYNAAKVDEDASFVCRVYACLDSRDILHVGAITDKQPGNLFLAFLKLK